MGIRVLSLAIDKFVKLCYDSKSVKNLLGVLDYEGLVYDLDDNDREEWYYINSNILNKYLDAFSYSRGFGTKDAKGNLIIVYEYNDEIITISKVRLVEEDLINPISYYYNTKNIKINILDSSFIKGVKSIPDLYITDIKVEELGKEILSKEYMFYGYLIKPVFELMNEVGDINDVKEFVDDNKGELDKIARNFEYSPVFLGKGQDGFAFDIGNGMVLKIFKNRSPYDAALKSMDWLHKGLDVAKTEAMIYDAGTLDLSGKEIYYYIIQKMKPVYGINSNAQNWLIQLVKYITNYYKRNVSKLNIDLENNYKAILPIVNDISKSLKRGVNYNEFPLNRENIYENITKAYNLNDNWLNEFIEEVLVKRITLRRDLHIGNIGITNSGHVRYFDPSFKEENKEESAATNIWSDDTTIPK
jgi:hypothetical protein